MAGRFRSPAEKLWAVRGGRRRLAVRRLCSSTNEVWAGRCLHLFRGRKLTVLALGVTRVVLEKVLGRMKQRRAELADFRADKVADG